MLSNIWRDIRYTLRTLRLNPGFALAAAAPIALGIGINTGVFTILYNLAMRPHPVPGARELVSVHQEFQGVKGRQVHGARMMFSAPEYRIYRDSTKTLSGITAYSSEWTVTIGDRFPREVEGDLVVCNYFEVLQVRPAIGTGFTAAHCEPNHPVPAVVLSHALWTHVLGADPDIVRQTIILNGQAVAVAGVAPEGFEGIGLTKAAFFAPLTLQPLFHPERTFLDDPQMSWLTLIGRRTQDLRQVRAELAVIAGQIDGMQPGRMTSLIVEPANALALPVARRGFLGMSAIAMAAFSIGTAHRLCQRRERAAGPRGQSHEGDRDSPLGRRAARPADPAAPHREPDHRDRGGTRRAGARMVGVQGAAAAAARDASGLDFLDQDGCAAEPDRAGVCLGSHHRHGARVRHGPGPSRLEGRISTR